MFGTVDADTKGNPGLLSPELETSPKVTIEFSQTILGIPFSGEGSGAMHVWGKICFESSLLFGIVLVMVSNAVFPWTVKFSIICGCTCLKYCDLLPDAH